MPAPRPATGEHRGAKQVIRQLAPSVYVPTLLEFSGEAALMPVIPLLALQLGFGVSEAAALTVIFGLASFLGPIPAGRLISRIGARTSLVATGLLLVVTNVIAFLVITPGLTGAPGLGHRAMLIVLLAVVAANSQVWALGRQAYLGTALPPAMRARGMTMFGGMIRVGQVVGPLLGAAVIAIGQDSWVFILFALLAGLATGMVAIYLPHGEGVVAAPARGAARRRRTPSRSRLNRAVVGRMLRIGLGITPVMIARVNRPVVVPLLGAALGLDSVWISIVFGATAVIEILMVIPAGTLMDRFGRAAVAVPCALSMGIGYLLLAALASTLGTQGFSSAVLSLLLPSLLIAFGNGLGSGIVMTLGIDVSPVYGRTVYLAWWNTLLGAGRLVAPLMVTGITLIAPVAVAAAVSGALCVVGGGWLSRVLPQLRPSGGGLNGRARSRP